MKKKVARKRVHPKKGGASKKKRPARSSTNTRLLRHVTADEFEEAIAMVKAERDALDFKDAELLLECARSGHVPLVKLILKLGAPVDVRFCGYTLTHAAVASGEPKCVQFVLSKSAPPDADRGNGVTPLYLNSSECRLDLGEESVRRARVSIAKTLLQFGANPNVVAFESSTPVTEALKHRNVPLTTFLIRHGAKPTKSAGLNAEALSLAVEVGSLPFVKELIRAGWDPKRLPRTPLENPLSTAVQCENYGLVKLLVDSGAHPARESAFQAAPIALAAEAEDERILRYLQKKLKKTGRASRTDRRA